MGKQIKVGFVVFPPWAGEVFGGTAQRLAAQQKHHDDDEENQAYRAAANIEGTGKYR